MTTAAPAPHASRPLGTPVGRIPVTKVTPVIEGGAYPAKASIGEAIPVTARVFREGHDAVNASVVLTSPGGQQTVLPLRQVEPWGLDIWRTEIRLDQVGPWTFRVEGWSDPWATWVHHAEAKLPASIDVELVCLEGRHVVERVLAEAELSDEEASTLRSALAELDASRPTEDLLATAQRADVAAVVLAHPPRDLVSPTPDYPIFCDRERARFSAWYEFFPRSAGAIFDEATQTWTSGTFDTAVSMLDHAAAMGFDVVYLPPIHPIGTAFRKGKNNSLDAGEDQPGSPWAVGGAAGGHDAIHPDLGDEAAFGRFVAAAKARHLEVALDLALQASPDHPWVEDHPEWFAQRADGSIAFAENPPKKYQDIYPINFDRDPQGIANEVLRIVKLWISRGVTIFRVDNPHTKPVAFWGWLIAEVRRTNPEVIFLAEAFTRPEMMHMLGKVGFQLSYTYFTWRTSAWEIKEYLRELTTEMADFYRPSFWPNTPDINPKELQSGNPAAFAIRAVLAALLSPSWGIYSGFEICEHEPFRAEEYLNSEKYEYRPRDFSHEPNVIDLVTTLNRLRREHPALQQLRDIQFHATNSDDVLCFSKREGDDRIVVVCSLAPDRDVEAWVDLDVAAMGMPDAAWVQLDDLLSGETFWWQRRGWVGLSPMRVAHVFTVMKSA